MEYVPKRKKRQFVNKRLLEHKYEPRIRTSSQGSMLVNQMKDKTFVHKVVGVSQLWTDENMNFDFNDVKRDEIPADVLIKFKWRVILKLMESKGP